MFACPATDDFFRSRIDQMIDLRHPLAVLSSRMKNVASGCRTINPPCRVEGAVHTNEARALSETCFSIPYSV